jgi:hypothetical protein
MGIFTSNKPLPVAEFRVPLGVLAKDRISGFTGVVESRTQYLTGCNRIAMRQQGVKPDGGLYELIGFDEPFVEVVDDKVVQPVVPRASDSGGPQPLPSRGR